MEVRSHGTAGDDGALGPKHRSWERAVMVVTSLLGEGRSGLCHEQAVHQKRQTVMVVTGAVSDWEYLPGTTN